MSNQLPTITSTIAPDLRNFLNRVREAFEDPNGLVTKEDLINSGVFQSDAQGDLEFLEPGEVESCIAPPAPVSLTASGAMTSVILTWGGVSYNPCYSHTEIWRADTNDLGQAVLIGTATAGMFADAVGSDDSNYYWVRFVNVLSDTGPYNQTAGTAGATAPDLAYVFEQLTEAYGTGSDAPFFQLDSDTTINGVVIAAGTYIKEAKIHNSQITTAKIKDAAIDSAKIASAAIITAKIADAQITNAKINDLNASKITAGTINAARIAAGSITADKVTLSAGDVAAGTTASSGARMNITTTTIKIYDASNLRVHLGDLS